MGEGGRVDLGKVFRKDRKDFHFLDGVEPEVAFEGKVRGQGIFWITCFPRKDP
jgi:hypothetical protein